MSVRRPAPDHIQPSAFAFDTKNSAWADAQIAKYPPGRQASAVIPLLWQAQYQAGGWLPKAAIEHVAQKLAMAPIRVMEVATFYTMFNLEPVGQHFIQLCGTVPCHCMGALDLKKVLTEKIGPERHITADGKFSWLEVECLGACTNAPMVQINDDYFEDLTPETMLKLIDDLASGKKVTPGPQNGRKASEPKDAVKTLNDNALYDGSVVGSWKQAFDTRYAAAQKAKEEAARAAEAAKAAGVAPASAPAAPLVTTSAPAKTPADKAKSDIAQQDIAKASAPAPVGDEHKPALLATARDGKGDDLKLIWGVGPKLAAMLNGMGIFHFEQIASWTAQNLAWVDQHLGTFKGRAERDDWIDQAKKLSSGWRPDNAVGDRPKGA